jgi:phage tail tube protein FII
MNRAVSVSLLMARYLAGNDNLKECGDIVIPRLLARLERSDAKSIHQQVAIQLEQLGGEVAAGGREREALRCFIIVSKTLFVHTISSRVSGYIFAMRNNIALKSKAKEDVEAALQHFDSLPPSEREQFAKRCEN